MSVAATMPAPTAPAPHPFDFRLAVGLGGILVAAMAAGLNNRVPGLVVADIQGALGFARDDSTWLTTAYTAGELAAMPFATWFAITYSLKRFHLVMLAVSVGLALILPFVLHLEVLVLLRFLQGIASGALIPLLMMAALRFLPLPIRLHGLALYALTATFAPNLAVWLGATFVDQLHDWRWAYWHVIPLSLLGGAMVAWGIPTLPTAYPRIKQANWIGMMLGIPGLAMLVIGLDQGVRLDWLASPLIQASLLLGIAFVSLFLVTEWFHPAPFIKLQLLSRRNLGLGFSIFVALLMTITASISIPLSFLASFHALRLEQTYVVALVVAVPQLLLGSAVALLLYRKWCDARKTFCAGLMLMAIGLWKGAGIDPQWMTPELVSVQVFHALGQPLAVVSMLFLSTSTVQPFEGPYVAGIVNTLRVLSTLLGSTAVSAFMHHRTQNYQESLLAHMSLNATNTPGLDAQQNLAQVIGQQASVLASADAYRAFALLAVLLIPMVLCLNRVPAPNVPPPGKKNP